MSQTRDAALRRMIAGLTIKPDMGLMHPVSGNKTLKEDLMRILGEGRSGIGPKTPRVISVFSPLAFDLDDARRAFRACGANCGPGAIAAIAGISPAEAATGMPGFAERRYATEVMMALRLAQLGVRFSWRLVLRPVSVWPETGLVRVGFGSGDAMALMRKSHWVATRRSAGAREVFDINAMGVGGWISEEEWRRHMLPWIAETCFDGASGVTDIESFRL